MKKLLCLIPLLCLTASAQTNALPSFLGDVSSLLGPLANATNYSVAPYATYAPDAPDKYGGGVLIAYNVNNYVGLAIGADWLGQLSLYSGNLTLKLPIRPLERYGFSNFVATPFVLMGIGTPLSGAGKENGSASTVTDIGAMFQFGHLWGGRFGAGACAGTWTGTGPYDVLRYHGFVSWSKGF